MDEFKCTLTLTSHGVRASHATPIAKQAIWEVLSSNRSYKSEFDHKKKRMVNVLKEVFFFFADDRSHVAFHRNQLPEILDKFKSANIQEKHIKYIYEDGYEGENADIQLMDFYKERDYQKPIVQHVIDNKPTAVVPIQTGRGKGLISLFASSAIGKRVGVITSSFYNEKWYDEIEETVKDINPDNCVIIKRTKGLLRAYFMEKDFRDRGLDTGVKFYIMSTETLNSFINRFIIKGEFCDGLNPFDLFQTLGIGFTIRDEIHEKFHQYFKTEVYLHSAHVCGLSATISDRRNNFMEKMYRLVWPRETRYEKLDKLRYTDYYNCYYAAEGIKPSMYQRQSNYSHQKYEQTILSNKKAKEDYMNMVTGLIDNSFLPDYQEGDRCIVYAFMNDMVDTMYGSIKEKYKDKKVSTYVRDEPLDNIINSDITVTSHVKAAAAVDVPGLTTVINTINTGSEKRIIQSAGRLRMREDGRTRFINTLSPDIPKHLDYKDFASSCLRDVVKSISDKDTGHKVRFYKEAKNK